MTPTRPEWVLAGPPPGGQGGSGQPAWVVASADTDLPPIEAAVTQTSDLDGVRHDATAVELHVQELLAALYMAYADLARTPSGISWLDVHRVPVLRLLRQAVGKILALGAWPPFVQAPTVANLVHPESAVSERATSASEYRYYTVTWPGIGYLLGAPEPQRSQPATSFPDDPGPPTAGRETPVGRTAPSPEAGDVVAVSWSSRHVETLRPVLDELVGRGRNCIVLDFATGTTDKFDGTATGRVRVHDVSDVLASPGGLPEPHELQTDATIAIGTATVMVDRVLRVVGSVLEHSTGATQPSWAATLRGDELISTTLGHASPRTLVCCNDTSPLGHLAVRVAEARHVDTVYLQHGAWIPNEVAWPALHCRRIVVMGERDRELAVAWATHPDATIHALGQPRFDALAALDRANHRQRLRSSFPDASHPLPERIAVLATQPFGDDQLRHHLELAIEGTRLAEEAWALVVASHPAQSTNALQQLLDELLRRQSHPPPVAMAGEGIGARSCLAGADALLTVSSTCGIEAVLLDVPVVELAPANERTLRLAEHGAAAKSTTPEEVARALDLSGRMGAPSAVVKDSVCHWDGNTAHRVADVVLHRVSR